MTEKEIMRRAREYHALKFPEDKEIALKIRAGEHDDWSNVTAYAQAMRDCHKPLSELVQVDPDLLIAREICALRWNVASQPWIARRYRNGDWDLDGEMNITLFAVKHMQKLSGDKS